MNKKEFLIWIAGFVDGEGSIGISRVSKPDGRVSYNRVFFCITNNDKKTLEEIKKFFGDIGTIKQKIKKKDPLIESNKNRFGKRDCYDFALGKRQAKEVLKMLYPYLKVKKKQARLVLDLPAQRWIANRETGKHHGGRIADKKIEKIQEKMYWQSRKLNSGSSRYKKTLV